MGGIGLKNRRNLLENITYFYNIDVLFLYLKYCNY